jgi:hypothetical protein
MRTWLLALLVAAVQAHPSTSEARTSTAQTSAAQTPAGPQGYRPPAPATEQRPGSEVQLPVSLDRIKRELGEAPPPPAPSLKIGELPTFRVTVYGRRKPILPDFSASLKQEWQPIVPGGIHNLEVMNMITPPQARPFAAHINGDLAQVAASALVNALLGRAMLTGYHAARKGWRNHREQQVHDEVAAELAAFLLANPQPPPETLPAKKAGDKKEGAPDKQPEARN